MLKIVKRGEVVHTTDDTLLTARDARAALAIVGGLIALRGTNSEKIAFIEIERYLRQQADVEDAVSRRKIQ
jgi:hypothetical protein